MIPLFERDGFIIAFEAEPEPASMREHFVTECGWSASEYRRIRHCAWFSAKVSAWKDGIEVSATYLGCCCYLTVDEFYTTYAGEYFAGMVQEVIDASRSGLVAGIGAGQAGAA